MLLISCSIQAFLLHHCNITYSLNHTNSFSNSIHTNSPPLLLDQQAHFYLFFSTLLFFFFIFIPCYLLKLRFQPVTYFFNNFEYVRDLLITFFPGSTMDSGGRYSTRRIYPVDKIFFTVSCIYENSRSTACSRLFWLKSSDAFQSEIPGCIQVVISLMPVFTNEFLPFSM